MRRNQKMGPGRHIFPLVEGRKPWRTESASKECMWWWILLMALNIFIIPCAVFGLPRWRSGKDSACQCRRRKRLGFNLWVRKIPWRRKWQPTPVSLPGKFHGQRSLAGYTVHGSVAKSPTQLSDFTFSCCGAWALGHVGSVMAAIVVAQASWFHSMWDLPRPRIEPVFPALAGGFFTTELPGKPPCTSWGRSFSKTRTRSSKRM